jgi:hypothetical protein
MRAEEPTRVRNQGTVVTRPKTPEERIAAIRRIVTEGQYAKVDGTMIDLFSASAVIGVYDKLNPENQAKYAAMPAGKMALVAFKLLK